MVNELYTKIQAKHIPEKALIDLIDRLYNTPELSLVLDDDGMVKTRYSASASFKNICKLWDNIPPKVIWTKLQKLEERGLIRSSGPSSSHFVVVHESELPVRVHFDEDLGRRVVIPLTHKQARDWLNE